jgi:hypothetical protein
MKNLPVDEKEEKHVLRIVLLPISKSIGRQPLSKPVAIA